MGGLVLIVPGAVLFVLGVDPGGTPEILRVLTGVGLGLVVYRIGDSFAMWLLDRPWFPWARVSK